MFKNYFKTAFRSLNRNRNYTIINIAGLAVGIAVCMMIFIIIQYQTSFDNFHSKKDRIFRVLTEYHHAEDANITYGKDVPFPMPTGLKTAFPQIEQVAPIFASHDDQLLIPDWEDRLKSFYRRNIDIYFFIQLKRQHNKCLSVFKYRKFKSKIVIFTQNHYPPF